MKRRAAAEPVIAHLKAEHRMDRNHLKGRECDRFSAVLAAAGYNFGLLLRWLAPIWHAIFDAFSRKPTASRSAPNWPVRDSSRATPEVLKR